MTRPNIAKMILEPPLKKGAQAPKVSVTQNMRVRDGRAPHILTPPTVPTTSGPVSVTRSKA